MTDNLDELRHIEGFPLGKDEDLLALSTPPYYTAYPNPHIEEFIRQYGKPYDEATDDYHREPFVTDVSEGKNDPIYNAHSYHTKLPYKAIIPFIEHYTDPGDIIFDGFCGTGMTGLASQLAGRRAILCDLSPIATFISVNYNFQVDLDEFKKETRKILKDTESEFGWIYETIHNNGQVGTTNYTVWSDVFLCPYCGSDIVFWDAAIDVENGKVLEVFPCPSCKAKLSKRDIPHAIDKFFDVDQKISLDRNRQVPVFTNYNFGCKRFEKRPDDNDIICLKKIESNVIPYWYPPYRMMNMRPDKNIWGDEWRAGRNFVYISELHTKRNLLALASLRYRIRSANKDIQNILLFSLTGIIPNTSRMYRWRSNLKGGTVSGTYYLPSTPQELNVFQAFESKAHSIVEAFRQRYSIDFSKIIISTQSATDLSNIEDNTVDYIFTDPPFGDNLMYSELNFIWEAWLKVFTNNGSEAIINKTQNKSLDEYRDLMTRCFSEMFRILKPGHWITVVFHNSKASVWNAIQESLTKACFVVAQVTVMDKQQGSFKQVTNPGAVKNDLVINAYKSRIGFIEKLIVLSGKGLEVDFVREHLHQLPIDINIERSKEMLYSKYLAYYVQHGYQVMYNSEQFYKALSQWGLEERDGFWFADEIQINEYEKRKAITFGKGGIQPQAVLFVSDERSARQWIWNFLDQPKTYDEIYTDFLKALQTSEDEIPEVKVILEESFVRTNGHWKRPDQLTQAELEKKRLERLLRQFEEYLNTAKANQKLKEVRLEAVIAGFTECYRSGRYKDILLVGKKLDKGILENSSDLYDFIDIAEAKVEG